MTHLELSGSDLQVILAYLALLSRQTGLVIRIEEPTSPLRETADDGRVEESAVIMRMRADFAWLAYQSKILEAARGCYVAVYERHLNIGPNPELAAQGLADLHQVDRDAILVVPIAVPGSEFDWQRTAQRIGIDESSI